jgi:hypothetical protein
MMFADIEEVAVLRSRFERCELSGAEFNHASHVAVITLDLLEAAAPQQALQRMSAALKQFAAHHGSTAYNQTITVFWLALIAHFVAEHASATGTEVINAAVERFADKQLVFAHYSRERVLSAAAKSRFIAPDLRPLPFAVYQ